MVWSPRDSSSCPPLPHKERAQRRVNPDRCAIPQRMEPRGMIIPLALAPVDTRPALALNLMA